MKNSILLFLLFFVSQTVFSQALDNSFYTQADKFFKKHVTNGKVDYANAKTSSTLKTLITRIENTNLSNADNLNKKAFYINAYNLLVINAAAKAYPIGSVLDNAGFFDKVKHKVAGQTTTLNNLEKDKLLKPTKDARLHFVLVCGAIDCPPIVNFAYTPEKLDIQMETQTRKALNNPQFIKTSGNKVELSQIFKWYTNDFGGSQKSVIKFINKYRKNSLNPSAKFSYYNYNWQLNDYSAGQSSVSGSPSAANAARYVVSAAIPKGSFELKVFNNLYTQRTGSEGVLTDRSTFFTSNFSALYGVTDRFNAGIELKYRRVNYSNLPSSAFDVFKFEDADNITRTGLTGIGLKIRVAPFKKLENFSFQSTLTFPTSDDLEGTADLPYIDWNGATSWTQFFYDFDIGTNFSFFTEVDLIIENIGEEPEGGNPFVNRVSTPVSVIFSYFPNPKTTIYALGGFSPYIQADFDYFVQGGVGVKYQVTPNFELETLFTGFTNQFLLDTGGKASTVNLGARYSF